jgi:hypothetical protein
MPKTTHTPHASFRLSEETRADLDLIAEHHARETGAPANRSDALRLAAKREADRIRRAEKRGEK